MLLKDKGKWLRKKNKKVFFFWCFSSSQVVIPLEIKSEGSQMPRHQKRNTNSGDQKSAALCGAGINSIWLVECGAKKKKKLALCNIIKLREYPKASTTK